ncbi:MAG TPA: methyltransferase domain-containing protein [Mycobacteriales bacterium]|nr:methyltransferase domain-containing protein [Mycobacteriales bacterium]
MDGQEAVRLNRIFHDHECGYYDERFAIVHDTRSARCARREVERLLGRPLRRGEVVVDAGCGTGWLAAGLCRAAPRARVIGVDLSAGMLARARAAGAWPLLQADAQRLPFDGATVDLVVCRGVLHHLPDVPAALAEWRRVLRPSGAVVVASEPTPTVDRHGGLLVRGLLPVLHRSLSAEEDFWEVASTAASLHVFTPDELAAMARAAGFRQARLSTADFLSTLVLAASYVAHGRRRGLARRLPWRRLAAVASTVDGLVLDRVLPGSLRHTVVGVLRP